jgi:hypothetical protein
MLATVADINNTPAILAFFLFEFISFLLFLVASDDFHFGSGDNAALLVAAALIVLGRAVYWAPQGWFGLFRWGTWALVPLLALSALANFASKSRWEKTILGPLALLCLAVALGPGRAM